ncbi:MAG: hypothetical protein H0X50_05320 [Nitrosopumilus sp.]|nr:hypothetical protein [Nitrosopumilus sp.]
MSNSNNVVDNDNEINWSEVIKKEARGSNDADFGEVQEVVLHYVLTEKGILNKDKFYLPRALVEGFDGDKLRFNISEEEADEKFKRDEAPAAEEYDIFSRKKTLKTKNFEPKEADKQQDKQVVDKEFEERARQQAEEKAKMEAERKAQSIAQQIQDKAKMEAERKAQSIAQQIQDKAKMEAERKAQSIIQEARDKAKVEVDEVVKMEADQKANEIIEETEEKAKKEAEENSQSIIQQAEDRARQEADRRSKELIQQAEDRARQEAEDKITRTPQTTEKMILYTQEEIRNPEVNGYDANNPVFNPFITGITLWQNYSTIWMNISKQILGNTKRMARDFEDTMGKTWSKSRW